MKFVRGALLAAVLSGSGVMAQFIPDKPVVIHPAVLSKAEQVGSIKGPERGLGATVPAAMPRRPNRNSAVPFPAPPVAPAVSAAAAAVEQTTQGNRKAIEMVASFDGLGEGLLAEERGGIDISVAAGPNHIVQILDGRTAVFSKKGKKYKESGRLLFGPVANNTDYSAGEDRGCTLSLPLRWTAEQLRVTAGNRQAARFTGRQVDTAAGVPEFRES